MIRTYKQFEAALKKSGKDIKEVKKLLGVPDNYLWRWKNGKIKLPSVDKLDKLDKYFKN